MRPCRQAVTAIVAMIFGAALCCSGAAAQVPGKAPDYVRLRADNAKELTQPYGWFSLIALEWLKPGTTTVGSAKDNSVVLASAPAHLMTLEQKDGVVAIQSAAPPLTLAGQPVGGHAVISAKEDSGSAMASGTLRMWAIYRGGRRYLRVKDSNAPALSSFHGLSWYPPDPHFRVEARWIPYTTPHILKVMNKLDQLTPVPVPGYIEFELDGQRQTLIPMSADKDGLFFVFRDATFLHTTDGGGRFLSSAAPSNGVDKPGTVTLDFNLAENPPCAYSPYATCPLASPENRLPVSVTAGEKRYE